MNEFDTLRRLRELNAPRTPQTDLWPAIAERIATAPPRRAAWLPVAAAAAVVLAVAGSLYVGLQPQLTVERTGSDLATLPRVSPSAAIAAASASDPRLAGAGVVLDAAQAELEQALEQRPDAAFLVGLLSRTNAQRVKLEHYGASAG